MKKNNTKVNKELFEVHKPSGQISSKITKDGKLHQLTPTQFDAMNYICYQAREQFHQKFGGIEKLEKLKAEKTDSEIFAFLSDNWFEIDLVELSKFTETYISDKDKSYLSNTIKELKSINVEMGVFKKHNLLVEDVFSLIRRYNKIQNQNKIKVMLEPEILIGWVFKTTPFKSLFLKIQTKLSQTYTKVLYENLKDYETTGEVSKPLEHWNFILGFDNKSSKAVSTLKRDFLNKSVVEINEKTDLKILKIDGKKSNGETVLTIKFEKQPEYRLIELGIVGSKLDSLPYYQKAKNKLDALIKGGYTVVDEDMWIQSDIKKNEERYSCETKLDAWEKKLTSEFKTTFFQDLAYHIDSCDDFTVHIKDYRIVGVFTQDIFTKDAKETMETINNIIDIIDGANDETENK